MKLHIKIPIWPALLGVAFVVLKLAGVIGWSWWWVLAPFWVPTAVAFVIFAGVVVVASVGGKTWRS